MSPFRQSAGANRAKSDPVRSGYLGFFGNGNNVIAETQATQKPEAHGLPGNIWLCRQAPVVCKTKHGLLEFRFQEYPGQVLSHQGCDVCGITRVRKTYKVAAEDER